MKGSYKFLSVCSVLKFRDRHITLFCYKMFQSFIIHTTRKLNTSKSTSSFLFVYLFMHVIHIYFYIPALLALFCPYSKLSSSDQNWVNKTTLSFVGEAGLKMTNNVMGELMSSSLIPIGPYAQINLLLSCLTWSVLQPACYHSNYNPK